LVEEYRKEGLRKEGANNTYKPLVGTILENRGLRFESEANAETSVNRIHWQPGTRQSFHLHAEECSEGRVNLRQELKQRQNTRRSALVANDKVLFRDGEASLAERFSNQTVRIEIDLPVMVRSP
jgi:hypothetical protein